MNARSPHIDQAALDAKHPVILEAKDLLYRFSQKRRIDFLAKTVLTCGEWAQFPTS